MFESVSCNVLIVAQYKISHLSIFLKQQADKEYVFTKQQSDSVCVFKVEVETLTGKRKLKETYHNLEQNKV